MPETREALLSELTTVRNLVDRVRIQDAYSALSSIVEDTPASLLIDCRENLMHTIDQFLPKKREALQKRLLERLAGASGSDSKSQARGHRFDDREYRRLVRSRLGELSERYIFDWSGQYLITVHDIFSEGRALYAEELKGRQVINVLREEFREHAREVYAKGRDYQLAKRQLDSSSVVAKSLGGLRSFLELVVSAYTADVGQVTRIGEARATRAVSSSMLLGILEGYGEVEIDDHLGWHHMCHYPRAWCWAGSFMRADHLQQLAGDMPVCLWKSALQSYLEPLAAAIDRVLQDDRETWLVPVDSLYEYQQDRLVIEAAIEGVGGQSGSVQIHCYLRPAIVSVDELKVTARQGVALVLCELEPGAQADVNYDTMLSDVVVQASDANASRQCEHALLEAIGEPSAKKPLVGNPARQFPIDRPTRTPYYSVHRTAVRKLLQGFENQNGVHLWCSVRRSGKTTACLQMEAAGELPVIYQTCSPTDTDSASGLLYEKLCKYLDCGQSLPGGFIHESVETVANAVRGTGRQILVLDEYETVFERLQHAIWRNPEVRYTIAQPFLNQLVAFSRENLVVLVGQRPDAYHIIPDQNQLIPCVVQDRFPLFQFNPASPVDEYSAFIDRVLRRNLLIDERLVKALHTETGGHPYLTVNLLSDFLDWHIEHNAPRKRDPLRLEQFVEYSRHRLTPKAIALCRDYELFHAMSRSCTSTYGRQETPWLYLVFSLMRWIALQSSESLQVGVDDAINFVKRLAADADLPFGAEDLLRNAEHANFLSLDMEAGLLRPRIPLLARIAAVSGSEVA